MIKIRMIIPVWPNFARAAQTHFRQSLAALNLAIKAQSTHQIETVVSPAALLSVARNAGVDPQAPIDNRKYRQVSGADYYLFCDADIGFTLQNIIDLVKCNAPVIGGACHYRMGDNTGDYVAGYWQVNGTPGINTSLVSGKTPPGIYQVNWIGAAFLLVRNDVFCQMPYPWFHFGVIDLGETAYEYGEDNGFCLGCLHNQIPILVHTGLNLVHKHDDLGTWDK